MGLTIPWAIGGTRYARDGSVLTAPEAWPDVPVHRIRLWDTRTAWLNLEPRPGMWDWSTLDGHVANAEARGVDDISLVLAGTPGWAAAQVRTTDAPWLGPGSASPPVDPQAWRAFVTAVVTRYAGRISSYEIGNEPNLSAFWSGTPDQYAVWVATAAEAVHAADPAATAVVAAGLVRHPGDVADLDPWVDALQRVEGIDALSVHFYPAADRMDRSADLVRRTAERLRRGTFTQTPLWVTEANITPGGFLAPDRQEQLVRDLTRSMQGAGFTRIDWYAWTDLGPQGQIHVGNGTPASAALADLV